MSPHFTSNRKTEIDELNKMLLDKVNVISNLIYSHKAEIEERDGMLLDKVNEVSVLMDSHQTEINERDNMLLVKSNEISNLIDTHQIEMAKLDRVLCEKRTEIAYLKEKLGLHGKEIAKSYHHISELENEILILKNARMGNLSRESREETIRHQSSQTDEENPGQPLTVYVTKEWHEKEMKDYFTLVNDEHQHFVQAVQEQILSAEYSKEIELESSNILHQKMQSENVMLKVDLSVLNDIHEADMAERNRVISDLCKENETLRANLTATVHASTNVQYFNVDDVDPSDVSLPPDSFDDEGGDDWSHPTSAASVTEESLLPPLSNNNHNKRGLDNGCRSDIDSFYNIPQEYLELDIDSINNKFNQQLFIGNQLLMCVQDDDEYLFTMKL